MTDLERIKKDVVEMDSRANVCWSDTKVLTKAVRLILEELTADRKTEPFDKDTNVRSKDEPQTNADQHVQHVESVKDETGRWVRVGQWEWEHHTDTTHFGKVKGESIATNKVEDEPQIDGILFKGNLKEGDYKLIKTSNGWVLEGNDIAYCGEPQTERKDK